MLSYVKTISRSFFKDGHERSLKIRKNVILSFLVKGASLPVSLILVPLTINYINPMQYGIWLTVSAIVGWMNFFDVGMGNGLKNKLAHSLALNEYDQIKKYVSTTYGVLAIIAVVFFVLFFCLSFFINWNSMLNVPASFPYNIRPVIIIVLLCFSIQFVVQTINVLLTATHKPSVSSLITFIGQLGILIIIYILTKYVPGNLVTLVAVLAGFPIVVMFVASIYLFNTQLKEFVPTLKNVDFKYAKSLFSTGGIFFFIQMGVLVLFQTDNLIITKVLGPKAVTTFNVSYKFFSLLVMIFTIIITPYWSAFTDAYAKQDFSWIRLSIKKMRQLWLALSAVSILLLLSSKVLFKAWIGNAVLVPVSLSLAMTVYVMAFMWQTLHVYLLNGVGKVRLQLFLVIGSAIINIPLAIFLGKHFGLPGIISTNTILFTIMGIIFSIQCEKIMNQTATGLWNK